MCLAMPTPPGNRLAGEAPGPVKLLLGGILFLAVLLWAALWARWRGG